MKSSLKDTSIQRRRRTSAKMTTIQRSFFFFFFVVVVVVVSADVVTAAITAPSDVLALQAFKAGLTSSSINPWSCLASWNFSSDPCTPQSSHFTCGLSCSTNPSGGGGGSGAVVARVSAITLDHAGYYGVLTSFISNLTHLLHLELSGNSFHGPIPYSLSSLRHLQNLVLSSNSFSGEIPTFSNLTSLRTLDLSQNNLAGALPPSISAMARLEILDLSSNRLSGSLPAKLPAKLVELALRENSLSGFLKRTTFGSLNRLEVAELSSNRFDGEVGWWFFNLPSLQQLNLANNSLVAVEVFAGDGGSEEGNRVVAVDLGFNRIDGQLPAGLAGFPALVSLSLRHNRLTGPIPWEYSSEKKGIPFRRLFLDGNFLNGRVPDLFVSDDGLVAGSFGDNCLDSCPEAAAPALCSPEQKPGWVCREVYGGDRRRLRLLR